MYFCSAARGATASGPCISVCCSRGYCFWSWSICFVPLLMGLLFLVHLFLFCCSWGFCSWSRSIYFSYVLLFVRLFLLVLLHILLFCFSWGYCSRSIYFFSASPGLVIGHLKLLAICNLNGNTVKNLL